ncbi:hypothetical protein TVAG_090520 [Trichomonas vaginalis G3]|uniref:Uncharacterized protein n=1 Tax=Trichomonas vaginalis (strain ATCC PRA-98 / G3) TaxID=412133 RepID=A2FA09_TRIV3|nr:hypothetical protein TVAGG3_0730160 [Trichomonas vaginalis G3]EAX98276.1 hypothetical protein TVAG_090520 [Trichomonas vaginalis G3]KAI5511202.1 hypothetical protein TVAGG3_0730160 [Trichomonas vaginalis G3]|eukprot:XP_001311206.1 hypothetical protein [Trichomonas vaginalis G3]
MRSFVNSLARANEQFIQEINKRKQIQAQNHKRFINLQKVARSALVFHPKRNPSQTLSHSSSTPLKRLEPLKPLKNENESENVHNNPFPYDNRPTFMNYALPRQPCVGANRIFNSVAARRFVNSEIETFIDQAENPNPSLSPLYAPSVDPVLHIGDFNELEINWNGE